MSKVARYAKFTAKPGEAARLAELLVAAAASLDADPGCELYLVNRQVDDADVVWVTEVWRSQADVDASVAQLRDDPRVAEVMALVVNAEMIELDPRGGKGV